MTNQRLEELETRLVELEDDLRYERQCSEVEMANLRGVITKLANQIMRLDRGVTSDQAQQLAVLYGEVWHVAGGEAWTVAEISASAAAEGNFKLAQALNAVGAGRKASDLLQRAEGLAFGPELLVVRRAGRGEHGARWRLVCVDVEESTEEALYEPSHDPGEQALARASALSAKLTFSGGDDEENADFGPTPA